MKYRVTDLFYFGLILDSIDGASFYAGFDDGTFAAHIRTVYKDCGMGNRIGMSFLVLGSVSFVDLYTIETFPTVPLNILEIAN